MNRSRPMGRVAMRAAAFLLLVAGLGAGRPGAVSAAEPSQVVDRQLRSEGLAHSRIGTDPVRRMAVYLPGGYEGSSLRYPVVYLLPNTFGDYRACFDQRGAQALFDRAIGEGVIGKFILVTVDLNTPLGCSWYVNSPVTGNWEDFVVRELVPMSTRTSGRSPAGIRAGSPGNSWAATARCGSAWSIRRCSARCTRCTRSAPARAC